MFEGQGHRSKVKVTRSKNVFRGWIFQVKGSSYLGIIDDFIGGDAKEATEEYDCTDIRRGVFSKRMRFFLLVRTASPG